MTISRYSNQNITISIVSEGVLNIVALATLRLRERGLLVINKLGDYIGPFSPGYAKPTCIG